MPSCSWSTVLKFASVVHPALLATHNTFRIEPFRALAAEGVDFDSAALALARGELRSRTAVKERLGAVAGAMFEQILLVERTEEELKELEEEIADPTDETLRWVKLKRYKRMLDMLSQEQQVIDLTIREGVDEDERHDIIACQNKLRGFASAVGLNVRGTPKRVATKHELTKKELGNASQRRTRKKPAKNEEENGEEENSEEEETTRQTMSKKTQRK